MCVRACVLTAQSDMMEVEEKLFSRPTICQDCDLKRYIHVERYGGPASSPRFREVRAAKMDSSQNIQASANISITTISFPHIPFLSH